MPSGALILLLEDSPDDAKLVERKLREAGIIFESKRMETEAAFAAAIGQGEPDLILSDYRLNGFDGLKALGMARRRFPDVPFILMSGVCGEELAIEALTHGATDYVLKDRLYRLGPAVRYALELGERRRADRAARENERKAEEALRASEQRFRMLVEAIPDFIVRLRDDGVIVDFKAPKDADLPAGTLASLGGALVGRALDQIGEPARRQQALQTGEVHSFEFQFPLHGQARDFEARVTVCGPRELLAIVRDVTERKRLETEVLEVSTLERRRIGHDLHDGLGQYLAGVAVKARILADDLAAESSPQRPVARKLVRLINSAIQQTRALARGLDPVEVGASGLVSALRKLAEETQELFRVPCRFQSSHSVVPLSNTAGEQLFRIAQEAINNAVNHGRAKHIEIELVLDSGQVRLRIKDDGRGFRVRTMRETGMGLRTMKYRTHTLAGVLKIASRPGAGTDIQCVVPLTVAGRFGERPH